MDDGWFIHEADLTPGSFHDLTSLPLLPLDDMEAGQRVYLDRAYESRLYEELLQEALGVVPMVKQQQAVCAPHAVTQEGFVLKVLHQ